MLLFSIVLYVFKFIHIISYSRELGSVSFILLYNLSRNFMDFSRTMVIHLDVLCLLFIKFHEFAQRMIILGIFNYLYNIVT